MMSDFSHRAASADGIRFRPLLRPLAQNCAVAGNLKYLEADDRIAYILDTAEIDDGRYRLYVTDKVRKGKETAQRDEVLSIEELKKEIESW